MKSLKWFVSSVIILSLVIGLVLPQQYNFGATPDPVTFDKQYYSIYLGDSVLPVLKNPAGKTVAIKSLKVINGPDIVKIDSKFNVKGLKIGYALLEATATTGAKTQTSFIVYEGMVTDLYKLALTVDETYALKMQSKQLKPIVSSLTYTSSDVSIATVDEKGVITAISPGTAYISINTPQESLQLSVGVFTADDPAKATFTALDNLTLQVYNVYLDNANILEASPTKPIYPILSDPNTTLMANQVIIKSSAPDILTVISKGNEYNTLYAKKAGKVTLSVTTNSLTKEFPLTVLAEPKVKSISILKKDTNFQTVDWTRIKTGLPMNLVLKVLYANGTTREIFGEQDGVKWTSSNPAICKIDHHSLIGVKPGDVVITASYKGMTAKFNMKIVLPH